MALQQGIHCFFASIAEAKTKNTPELYWILYNGAEVKSKVKLDLCSRKCGLVSTYRKGDLIHLRMTDLNDNMVYPYVFDGEKLQSEGLPRNDVKTQDVVSIVEWQRGVLNTVYKTNDGTYRLMRDGQPVYDENNKTIHLDYGPCCLRVGNSIYVAYQNDKDFRVKKFEENGRVYDITPRNTNLNSSPEIAMLGDRLFAIHHGKSNNRDLWCNIRYGNDEWRGDNRISNAELNDYPRSCLYGSRIYNFYQGTNNRLYCTVYIGNKWLRQDVEVKVKDVSIEGVWYGPAVVAV